MRRFAYGMASLSTSVLAPSGRSVMTAGSFGRLAYGLAAMFAPRFMAGRYAPAEPESVMSLRGFGGQYIAIAVFTLFSARSRHLARPALLLNVGVDVCNAMAGGFEGCPPATPGSASRASRPAHQAPPRPQARRERPWSR